MDDIDSFNTVLLAIKKLSPLDQDIFIFKFNYGFSNTEISSSLNMSEEALYKRIQRGKKKLRVFFRRGGFKYMNDKEIEDLLYKEMPLICERIIDNFPKDEDIHHEFSLEFETEINNLIKENNRRLLKRKVKRCLKVASLFLVFLGFSIFIGFKSTDANLKNIITNIKKVFQTHTVFEFDESCTDDDIQLYYTHILSSRCTLDIENGYASAYSLVKGKANTNKTSIIMKLQQYKNNQWITVT